MAKITLDDVEYVASLAHLSLDDDAKDRLVREMGDILSYFEKLEELDTENVEPMMHVLPIANVYRKDEIAPSLGRDEALAQAPQTDGAYFLVPRILDADAT